MRQNLQKVLLFMLIFSDITMNTTRIGTEFENRVFRLFSSLLEKDELPYASKKYSKIYQHKKYKCCRLSREIDFDITIETYNPNAKNEEWSLLVVIECKCLTRIMDISDLDEFEKKINNISEYGIKGIMVTTKGFSFNAIEQAKIGHIALMVLSEEKYDWIVSRDTNNYKHQMQILYGNEKPGLVPILYSDSQFVSLCDYLESVGVVISDRNVINIPWMENGEIKDKANELYRECDICSDDIAGTILAKKFPDFRINSEDYPSGILGSLSFANKKITISNEILSDEHRLNFTLAHELGHLYLHRNFLEKYMDELMDYEEEVVAKMPDKLIKRMEYQANLFASFLLIPQNALIREVDNLYRQYSITKGCLYLDNQMCNIQTVSIILGLLSSKFHVSKEVVKIRLQNENLLIVENYSPQRINGFLRTHY